MEKCDCGECENCLNKKQNTLNKIKKKSKSAAKVIGYGALGLLKLAGDIIEGMDD